jgi:hypothetical protein
MECNMPDPNPLLLTAIVSLVSALVGGTFVHFLTKRRDRDTKRRELVTKHLIEIWGDLDAAGRPKNNSDVLKMEKAVSNIQLFGSEKMMEMARAAAIEMSAVHTTDLTKLLTGLRDALRSELGLPATSQKYLALRISLPNDENKS